MLSGTHLFTSLIHQNQVILEYLLCSWQCAQGWGFEVEVPSTVSHKFECRQGDTY